MPRGKKKTKQPVKKAAKKRAAPERKKAAVKTRTARKISAPKAEKKEGKPMAKATTKIAPPPTVAPRTRSAKASTRAIGATGWKDTKQGVTQASISCYNCAWYEPAYGPGFQPRPNGGNGGSVRNNDDQEINPDAGSQWGWCRGDSVPQTNFNAFIAAYGWSLTTDYNVPQTNNLNEPIVLDATEFWCGFWVRTNNPFAFPPNQIEPPPPWAPPAPNGPVAPEDTRKEAKNE